MKRTQHRCTHCSSRNTRIVKSRFIRGEGGKDEIHRNCKCSDCQKPFFILLRVVNG